MDRVATVVIPCFNSEASLSQTLEWLERQCLRNRLHVIVVDNGSTDGSLTVARILADEVAIAPEKGTAIARNVGLSLTRTPLMLTLDADCYPVDEHWAQIHTCVMHSAPDHVIGSAGRSLPAPTHDRWANRADVTPHPAFLAEQPLYAVGGNGCYRTDAVRSLGGFPVCVNEDATLGAVARSAGYQYVWTPEAMVYHVNPEGWRGYYEQMYKIGGYTVELAGPPDQPLRFAAISARSLLANGRWLLRGNAHETVAGCLRVIAQTHGALTMWRRLTCETAANVR